MDFPSETKVSTELWRLRIPLARTIGTPGRSFSFTHVLLALIRDSQNNCGMGYSRFFDPADVEPSVLAAQALLPRAASLADVLDIERTEASAGAERRVASLAAANALSMAAWDLAGRRRGMACADLWGRPAGRETVDCYASALFLHTPVHELAAEARGYRSRNYHQVKMRAAPGVDETLARLAEVQTVYGEPGTIALEAALSWSVPTTNAFLRAAPVRPLWLEDPVKYDQLGEIKLGGHVIAAGEVLHSTSELVRLHGTGKIANIIIDVQAIGGPVRFLEAARLLHALGARIGSHRFPQQSAHLLACLPESLGVEAVDWANPSLSALPDPDPAGKVAVLGPGFNTSVHRQTIDDYGERVM